MSGALVILLILLLVLSGDDNDTPTGSAPVCPN